MMPLYTAYLTTGEYGLLDLASTVVNLMLPVLTLQVSASVMRFIMERPDDVSQVFMVGFKVLAAGGVLSFVLVPLLLKGTSLAPYSLLICVMYSASAIDEFGSNLARALGKVFLVGACGIAKTLLIAVSGVVLLVHVRMGIDGYLLSYIIGLAASGVTYLVRLKTWRYFTINHSNNGLAKEMLGYALPLIPNSVSWWINSYASRLFIIAFCGSSDLGLFAAASKIPSIATSVQSFFSQALTLSVIEEYDSNEGGGSAYFSELCELYSAAMVILSSVLIGAVPFIALFFLQGDFYEGWIYAPLLLFGVALGAQSGFFGTFYSASKRTQGMFTTTLAGCASNVVVSVALIPLMGLAGACVASAFSQIVIFLLRLRDVKRIVDITISRTSMLGYLLLLAQACLPFLNLSIAPLTAIQAMSLILIVLASRKALRQIGFLFSNLRHDAATNKFRNSGK